MGKAKHTNDKRMPCAVEPIRDIEQVHAIEGLLRDSGKIRDLLLWVTGVNCGLRAKDVLQLRVEHMLDKPINTVIEVVESKTGKKNFLVLNKKVHAVFKEYMATYSPEPGEPLFRSTRGGGPLTSSAVGKKIRSWVAAIGIECAHKYGAHTMRKTFGYINRIYRGVGIELLMKRYNHSTPRQTMTYLCITDNEVQEIMEEPI